MGNTVRPHTEIDYVQGMRNYLDLYKEEVNDLRYSIDDLTAEESELEERKKEINKDTIRKEESVREHIFKI